MNEIVPLTLIPIIAAASWSWAVARIAFPCFVRWTSHISIASTGSVATPTISWYQSYSTPCQSKTGSCERMSGSDTGAGPSRFKPTFWRMNDIPIAVISGASRGACRSGRYATRSIPVLRAAQNAIAQRSVTSSAGIRVESEFESSSPNHPTATENVTHEPSMNTSPLAKLISSRMP